MKDSNFSILISVITPCYNASRYLSQSIESVINQKFKDWELILIDDGSTDNTLEICKSYQEKDARIRVYHQENSGVSVARNKALKMARGQYITFIDSDDWFAEDAFPTFINAIKKYDADRYTFNRYTFNDGRTLKSDLYPSEIVRTGDQLKWAAIQMIYPYYDKIKNGVIVNGTRGVNCNVYRRSMIAENHIEFKEGMKVGEDALFNYEYVLISQKTITLNKYVGYYRINQSSIMHKMNADILHINDVTIKNFLEVTGSLLSEKDYKNAFLGMAAECIFRAYKLLILNKANQESLSFRKHQFRHWLRTPYIAKALESNELGILQPGKKQIVKFIKEGHLNLSLLVGWLAMKYLRFKGEI